MKVHPLTGEKGFKRLYDPVTKRLLCITHYTVLGEKEALHRREDRSVKHEGGFGGALWQADHELNLRARPGDQIFPSYGDHVSRRVIPYRHAIHLLAADFGHTDPTAIYALQILPHQIQVYYEHYLSGHDEATHKSRLMAGLVASWPLFDQLLLEKGDDFFRFYKAVGDKRGPAYMANYRKVPYPLRFRSPLAHISGHDEESKKLKRLEDDREAGEALLDGLFKRRKRCCFRVFAPETEKCSICSLPLEAHIGMVIDPCCVHAHEQLPLQVMEEGKRPKHLVDHAVDALRYGTLYAISLRGRKPPKREEAPRRRRRPQEEAVDIMLEEAYGAIPSLLRTFK